METYQAELSSVAKTQIAGFDFKSNHNLTLGVEMECQLIDAQRWALAPKATALMAAFPEGKLKHEFYLTDIELITSVCESALAAEKDLEQTIGRLLAWGKMHGIAFSGAGAHPFTLHRDCPITPTGHYKDTIRRHPWIIKRQMVYALHVHLGMPSGQVCIQRMHDFMPILPHLLALSTSSPFWEGEDTGLQAFRPLTYEVLPTAGLPYEMQCWADYEAIVRLLQQSGAIHDARDLWWDMRPNAQFGTLEIRVCDGLPTLSETMALTALIHCFAYWFSEQKAPQAPIASWIARENKWRVIRDGLNAKIIVPGSSGVKSLRQDIKDWLKALIPYFKVLGYEAYLDILEAILAKGTSADRQRRVFQTTQSLEAVVAHNVAEFALGRPLW